MCSLKHCSRLLLLALVIVIAHQFAPVRAASGRLAATLWLSAPVRAVAAVRAHTLAFVQSPTLGFGHAPTATDTGFARSYPATLA